jgi:hypothetical protein
MADNSAYLLMMQARLMALQAEMQGMIALNQERTSRGESLAYGEDAFCGISKVMNDIADQIAQYG